MLCFFPLDLSRFDSQRHGLNLLTFQGLSSNHLVLIRKSIVMIFAKMCCGRRKKAAASRPLEISLSQNCIRGRKARVEGGNLLHFLCPSAEETQLYSSFIWNTHTHTQPSWCVLNFTCALWSRQTGTGQQTSLILHCRISACCHGNREWKEGSSRMMNVARCNRHTQINNLNKP